MIFGDYWMEDFFGSRNKNRAATRQNQQNDCAPSEDSDEPGRPPSLIRVFAVRMMKAWTLSCPLSAERRLWSDWAEAKADLSLRWVHSHFVGFVMSRLKICREYWSESSRRDDMSPVTRKPVFGVCDQVRSNQPVQVQRLEIKSWNFGYSK